MNVEILTGSVNADDNGNFNATAPAIFGGYSTNTAIPPADPIPAPPAIPLPAPKVVVKNNTMKYVGIALAVGFVYLIFRKK